VRFSASDVFLLSPESATGQSGGEDELEGTVLGFSDSGTRARFFAVVEVVRRQTIIVPADKVTVLKTPEA
jgi:hypothetical protein